VAVGYSAIFQPLLVLLIPFPASTLVLGRWNQKTQNNKKTMEGKKQVKFPWLVFLILFVLWIFRTRWSRFSFFFFEIGFPRRVVVYELSSVMPSKVLSS
jgi:hypothetical protein